MKKLLLLTAFISFASISAFSQIDKGSFLVGGAVNFRSNKYESSSISSNNIVYQIQPNIGYFVLDRLAAGIKAGYQRSRYRVENSSFFEKRSEYAIAPFARYYFLPNTEKFNLFADASYQWGWASSTSNDYSEPSIYKLRGYSIAAGPALFLNPRVALELTIGYSYTNTTYEQKNYTIESGIGLQIHLGKAKAK